MFLLSIHFRRLRNNSGPYLYQQNKNGSNKAQKSIRAKIMYRASVKPNSNLSESVSMISSYTEYIP